MSIARVAVLAGTSAACAAVAGAAILWCATLFGCGSVHGPEWCADHEPAGFAIVVALGAAAVAPLLHWRYPWGVALGALCAAVLAGTVTIAWSTEVSTAGSCDGGLCGLGVMLGLLASPCVALIAGGITIAVLRMVGVRAARSRLRPPAGPGRDRA